jgi:hypothetical protein
MSLKEIRQAAIDRLEALFPLKSEFINVFDAENNPGNILGNGFNCIWGEGTPITGNTKRIALESILIVSLTKTVETRVNDNIAPLIDDLFVDIETVIKDFFNQTNLGITESWMRGFKRVNVAAPRLIAGNKFALINIYFVVDHTIDLI